MEVTLEMPAVLVGLEGFVRRPRRMANSGGSRTSGIVEGIRQVRCRLDRSYRMEQIVKFEILYRRTLHAELDALLDVSETARVGPHEYHNAKALSERTARKWAVDSLLMAAIVAPYGRDRVVESLKTEIGQYRRMIEIRSAIAASLETLDDADAKLIENYERTIALIEETISKL